MVRGRSDAVAVNELEEGTCPTCQGSGEGYCESSPCYACSGTGVQYYEGPSTIPVEPDLPDNPNDESPE
jgi:DnaJ-class molecular chaperone